MFNFRCLEVCKSDDEVLTLGLAANRWQIGLYFYGLHHRDCTSKDEIRVEQTGMLGLRMRSAAITVNTSWVAIIEVNKRCDAIASQQLSMISNDNTYINITSIR